MARPNIQIDDEIREMTEEEYANYLAVVEESKGLYPNLPVQESIVVAEEPVVEPLEGEQP
jgi:hypothetical protein